MNKTPVSILQEMMVQNQITPNYELIHDGGGTHINTFTYKVICDGLSATGTGRCKKDAKHEAAKAMLETIAAARGYPQLPASPAQSPVRTPLPTVVPASPRIPPNVPFHNAIGALQDLCCDNNLQEPEYRPISEVGPPHERIFTIQCVVATFREEGVATTKKQAKHEAAKKMLARLQDLVPDMNNTVQSEESRRKEAEAVEIAKARYPMLSRLQTTKRVNLGLKVSNYHVHLKQHFDCETRKEMITDLRSLIPKELEISKELYEQIKLGFSEFLADLSLELLNPSLSAKRDSVHISVMKINSNPELVQIAFGETKLNADFFALVKLINTMICFLE